MLSIPTLGPPCIGVRLCSYHISVQIYVPKNQLVLMRLKTHYSSATFYIVAELSAHFYTEVTQVCETPLPLQQIPVTIIAIFTSCALGCCCLRGAADI